MITRKLLSTVVISVFSGFVSDMLLLLQVISGTEHNIPPAAEVPAPPDMLIRSLVWDSAEWVDSDLVRSLMTTFLAVWEWDLLS